MRKSKIRIILILVTILSVISIVTNSYAHSGRTDSSGGHKDNKNKSGLGSYHYHCGGHPAHLHNNGVCPYSSSSSSSTTKTTNTVPSTIDVTGIQINEHIDNIEVGKNKILTATITPSNATDKSIKWESSDESIATVSTIGEVIGKKSGIVEITATSSNGKTNTIKINIKEEQKPQNTNIVSKNSTNKNNTNNTTTTYNREDSNPLGGFIALGLVGAGSYCAYKKFRK